MAYQLVGEILAVAAVFFSVVWVLLGYRGIRLGSLLLRRGTGDRAVELLRERYSRGEISTEDFNEKMKQLKGAG